jgi:lysozyme family protein
MTDEQIIAEVIEREGGFADVANDRGSFTKYGITAATLGQWRKLGRPATRAEVRALTSAEAADIYRVRYVQNPGFDRIVFQPLRVQLIDFGVNSGPERAIRWLQRVCRVAPVDGVLGQATAAAVNALPGWLVNEALVAARLYMVDATSDAPDQKAFEEGWENRALSFFLSRPGGAEVVRA